MMLDSFVQKKIHTHNTLGIPRFNKRINYYFFKIRYNQYLYNITKDFINLNQQKKIPKFVNFEIYIK